MKLVLRTGIGSLLWEQSTHANFTCVTHLKGVSLHKILSSFTNKKLNALTAAFDRLKIGACSWTETPEDHIFVVFFWSCQVMRMLEELSRQGQRCILVILKQVTMQKMTVIAWEFWCHSEIGLKSWWSLFHICPVFSQIKISSIRLLYWTKWISTGNLLVNNIIILNLKVMLALVDLCE